MERAFEPFVALARSLFLDEDPPVPVEAEVDAILMSLCALFYFDFTEWLLNEIRIDFYRPDVWSAVPNK